MNKHKKITRSGSITIPKDLRLSAGVLPGIAVDLTETEEGILISKHVPTCCFCGSPDKVISYHETEICSNCISVMSEEARKNAE